MGLANKLRGSAAPSQSQHQGSKIPPPAPGGAYYNAPQQGGNSYYNAPPPQGGSSYHNAPPQGGSTYYNAPPQGGSSYHHAPPQGGSSYHHAPPQGGSSYQQAPPQGGSTYHRLVPEGYAQTYPATGAAMGGYPSNNQYPPGEYPINQNQQYPAGEMPMGTGSGPVYDTLKRCVDENRLHGIYPDNRLRTLAGQLEGIRTRVDALSSRWSLSPAVARDLYKLALYDVVLLCDDSGSMAFAEKGERINDLKAAIGYIAEATALFDTDGISVRFLNSSVAGDNITSCGDADNLIRQVNFAGLTPLGTALETKILRPCFYDAMQSNTLNKPILIIIISDGQPAGEPEGHVVRVIQQVVSTQRPRGNLVAFAFAQVGTDAGAQQFLHDLDCNSEIGASVDVTSSYELEEQQLIAKGRTLTPEAWIAKLLLGAIDRHYDSLDELTTR